jgi:mannose/fructose/N-acetylgalactosamine-specific phosphotransferase system component IIC
MKGDRKQKNSRETKLLLTLGFIVAVYLKADASLFTTFAAGIVGASGAFMWGNAQEHKHAATAPAAPEPAKA